MASDSSSREGRPVEPDKARAGGNDPDAVRVERDERTQRGSRREESAASAGKTGREDQPSGTGDVGQESSQPDPSRSAGNRGDDLRSRTDPDQDSGRWRAQGPLTETYAGGGHGARLDGEEGGDNRQARRSASRDTDRGTSWPSVIYGWLAAVGATAILSIIVGAVAGALGAGGDVQQGGIAGLVGLIVTLLLAFLIGGYVAGRMAARSGFKHGLFVPLLALILALLLAVVGGVLGLNFADQLSSATLPGPLQDVAQGVQQPQNLGTILTVSGLLTLLAPFVGGILGGLWGAARGRSRP